VVSVFIATKRQHTVSRWLDGGRIALPYQFIFAFPLIAVVSWKGMFQIQNARGALSIIHY